MKFRITAIPYRSITAPFRDPLCAEINYLPWYYINNKYNHKQEFVIIMETRFLMGCIQQVLRAD